MTENATPIISLSEEAIQFAIGIEALQDADYATRLSFVERIKRLSAGRIPVRNYVAPNFQPNRIIPRWLLALCLAALGAFREKITPRKFTVLQP